MGCDAAPRRRQRRSRFLSHFVVFAVFLLCIGTLTGDSWAAIRFPRRRAQQVVGAELVRSFDLKDYIASRTQKIDHALESEVRSKIPQNAKIVEAMRYSLLAGGKRIRPVMLLASYEMVAKESAPSLRVAMPAALAVEMVHTATLIQDDLPCMDNDDLRRGKPSCHKQFSEDLAVLASDALLLDPLALIARRTPKSVPSDRILDVTAMLAEAVGSIGLAAGQAMDIECETRPCKLSDMQWVHVHKTAILLEYAVVAGAVLAGATKAEVAACRRYARSVGLAFQVTDDILDATKSTQELGKTAGKDADVGKQTYVALLGLDGAKAEADRLKKQAVLALASFGNKAVPLIAIAEYIVNRGH